MKKKGSFLCFKLELAEQLISDYHRREVDHELQLGTLGLIPPLITVPSSMIRIWSV